MAKNTNIQIIRAFEQLLGKKQFEKITVKDLSEKCGINRKTFYYYFSDMDDLLQKTFDWEVTSYIDNLSPETGVDEAVEKFFGLLNEYREVVYHVYNSSRCDQIKGYIRTSLVSMTKSSMEGGLEKYNISAEKKDLICSAYAYIFVGFIVDWLDSEMSYNLPDCVSNVRKMLKGTQSVVVANAEKD